MENKKKQSFCSLGEGLLDEKIKHAHNTPCDIEQIKSKGNNCLNVQKRELAQWAGLIRKTWSRA